MAKKTVDPFDKFREATLGQKSSPLSDALTVKTSKPEVKETPEVNTTPSPVSNPVSPTLSQNSAAFDKISKNANRELVSFHISKETKKKLNLLKVELEKSLGDLYNEAIDDLLAKYNRK